MWAPPRTPSAKPFPASEELPPPSGPTVKRSTNGSVYISSPSRADIPVRNDLFLSVSRSSVEEIRPQKEAAWSGGRRPPSLLSRTLRAPASDRTSFPEQAAFVTAETHAGAPLALCSESPLLGGFTCLVLFPAVQVLPLCSHLPAVSTSGSYFGTLARSGFIFPTLHFCLWLPLCWVFSGLLLTSCPQYRLPSSPGQLSSISSFFH